MFMDVGLRMNCSAFGVSGLGLISGLGSHGLPEVGAESAGCHLPAATRDKAKLAGL